MEHNSRIIGGISGIRGCGISGLCSTEVLDSSTGKWFKVMISLRYLLLHNQLQ